MAITVTDNRTELSSADATTGWSSPVGGESVTSFTVEPVPKELSAHNGVKVSNTEIELLFTAGSSVDMSSGILVYIWVLPQGIMDVTSSYGIAPVLGDGTNTNAYQLIGSDGAVFRHSSGSSVQYQCILIDTGSLPGTGKALRGTFGSFDDTVVTEFGCDFTTTVKSVGGVENCFMDKILHGNGGLTIVGTDTGSGFLDDLAVLDAAGTSGGSYGGCRDLGGGVYGIQIQILLGDTGTASDTLSIVDQTFKIENFGAVGVDKFGITIQGNSTGTQTFAFTNSVLFCPAGTGAFLTASDVDVDSFDMVGCLIQNFDQGIEFCTDGTNGPNHDISANTFFGCSQIDPGKTAFSDNVINSTTDANGGMLIDTLVSLTNITGLSFVSDGTGHAIYITQTGSYTFTDFTYAGYGATSSTDAAIYNDSGGSVTITVSGGDTPTYRNGTSADTTIVASVPLVIKVVDSTNTIITTAEVRVEETDGTLIKEGDTSGDGTLNETHTGATPLDVIIKVRSSSSGETRYFPVRTPSTIEATTGLTTTISMTIDTIASA